MSSDIASLGFGAGDAEVRPPHSLTAARRVLLSTLPAGRRARRMAATLALLWILFFIAAASFAKLPFAPDWAYIPIHQSALVTIDLVTAVLLFGLLATSIVLIVLLLENSALYERLIGAHEKSQRLLALHTERLRMLRENDGDQASLLERVKGQAAGLELRVRERTAELEAFSYSVSHDLRAPLQAIDGYARILEEDYAPRLDREGLRLLALVRGGSRHMGQLIVGLLDLSRLGRQELAKQPVDMTALAHEVAAELRPQWPAAEVRVASLPPALGTACC